MYSWNQSGPRWAPSSAARATASSSVLDWQLRTRPAPIRHRMGEALKCDRREQDWMPKLAPEQVHAWMATLHGPENAWQQRDRIPCRSVGAQRDLIGRATADVGPRVLVHHRAGMGLVVRQAHDARRNRRDARDLCHQAMSPSCGGALDPSSMARTRFSRWRKLVNATPATCNAVSASRSHASAVCNCSIHGSPQKRSVLV